MRDERGERRRGGDLFNEIDGENRGGLGVGRMGGIRRGKVMEEKLMLIEKWD